VWSLAASRPITQKLATKDAHLATRKRCVGTQASLVTMGEAPAAASDKPCLIFHAFCLPTRACRPVLTVLIAAHVMDSYGDSSCHREMTDPPRIYTRGSAAACSIILDCHFHQRLVTGHPEFAVEAYILLISLKLMNKIAKTPHSTLNSHPPPPTVNKFCLSLRD
jgi:hypothetical protein